MSDDIFGKIADRVREAQNMLPVMGQALLTRGVPHLVIVGASSEVRHHLQKLLELIDSIEKDFPQR